MGLHMRGAIEFADWTLRKLKISSYQKLRQRNILLNTRYRWMFRLGALFVLLLPVIIVISQIGYSLTVDTMAPPPLADLPGYENKLFAPSAPVNVDIALNTPDILLALGAALFIQFTMSIVMNLYYGQGAFCRILCPYAPMFVPFMNVSKIQQQITRTKQCDGCRSCSQACPQGIDVSREIYHFDGKVVNRECIKCYNCIDACDTDVLKDTSKPAAVQHEIIKGYEKRPWQKERINKEGYATAARHVQLFEGLGPTADFISIVVGFDRRRDRFPVRWILVLCRRYNMFYHIQIAVFFCSENILTRSACKCLTAETLNVLGDEMTNEKLKDFMELAHDLFEMLKERRKYWLAPLILGLLLIGTLIFALEGSIVAPLIYTISRLFSPILQDVALTMNALRTNVVIILMMIVIFDLATFVFLPDKYASRFDGYRQDGFSDSADKRFRSTPGRGTYPQNYFVKHSDRGFDIGMSRHGNHRVEGTSYPIWSNSIGCFDIEHRQYDRYVYIAGDSTAWGYTPFDEKFGTLLERTTGKQILKCGVTHTGQRHQLEKLVEIVDKIGVLPETILVTYSSNDIANDYAHPHTTVVSGWQMNSVTVDDDRKLNWQSYKNLQDKLDEWERRIGEARKRDDWLYRAKAAIKRFSLTAQLANQVIKNAKSECADMGLSCLPQDADGKQWYLDNPFAHQNRRHFSSSRALPRRMTFD